MTQAPITVLIADDQDLVRTGFAMVVDAADDMRVVATAADGAEAVALTARHRPDVVLMDIRMPRTDGITATRAILATAHPPKIVALTTYDSDDYATRILNAGAHGYLLKDATAEGLTAAIRTVHQGGSVLAPSTTRRLVAQTGTARTEPAPAAPTLATLTARERAVFDLIVAGASNTEIAQRLHLAEVTVKTHVGRVLAKLGVRDRVNIVVWAYRNGAVLTGEP
ncbi:response regulator [Micromonospora yangpuensis]|uniref:Two component transcriptional regulator, LuxR family n=1 Tax=Micromonospora yangpuensis TaxID=683228 RepID=A0A1C6UF03_9ACTN|nr:response regulator transcription factor [Micromonospora yangpuensis]GGM06082.1 DNA-binding response regulator [Micromonospora yangpuensis]SCL52562.1 two component transcriptional regulator, LuxR family [Micromonospora yangpuensis]